MRILVLLIICTIGVVALESTGDQELDAVLQLLTDLKTNAQKEIDALDVAWERHSKNKLSVTGALESSVTEQSSECYKKDQDVQSKIRDIKITNDYISWLQGRQVSNKQRIVVLEANLCSLSNNFIHDIKNYKIALALVQFLKQQVSNLQGASLIQKQEFHQQVKKFMKLYHTGKLIQMVETLQQPDGSFKLPEILDEEVDMTESALTESRGQQRKQAFLQQDQEQKFEDGENAVVLIPGCDNNIGTVVVVQNDDGSDDDLNIKFTNGGSSTRPKIHTDPVKPHVVPHPHVDPPHPHVDPVEESSSSNESDVTDSEGVDGESKGEKSSVTDETSSEEDGDEGSDDAREGFSIDDDAQGHFTKEDDDLLVVDPVLPHDDEDIESKGDGSGEEEYPEQTDKWWKPILVRPTPKTPEEDFTDDWDGFKNLLDALEKRSKSALETGQADEIRTAGTYIDFKIHIEHENDTFDKHILDEKDNLVKLNNQLTTRVSTARLCNSRLKQIKIAYTVSLEDYETSKKHYLELRKQKEEELAVFDDVYRIYTNQVAK